MKKLVTLFILFFACLLSPGAYAQISGFTSLCSGKFDTLTGLPAGGTWSSSNPSVASITTTGGIVTAISAGTTTISYSTWSTPIVLTVYASPAAITGMGYAYCGSPITLSDATPAGTWSSSNPAAATISSSGVLTPVSYSNTTISYTLSTGCYTTSYISVFASPAPSVSGSTMTCIGGTFTLSGTPSGGTWSTSGSGIATVSSGGMVTGTAAGTDSVLYTVSTGCGLVTAGWPITVTATPTAGPITGPSVFYCGISDTLFSPVGGGTWTSSTPSVATVASSTGIVTGITTGTATITYTAATGCGTASATKIVTVMPIAAGTLYSTYVLCGSTSTLFSSIPGGTWTSSTPSIATIGSSTGVCTGLATGTTMVTYTISSSCGTATTTAVVTVATGTAGMIFGSSTVCVGSAIGLSSSVPGGTWSTASATVSVSATGVVTGISGGTGIITYSIPVSCGTATSTKIVTVNAPTAGAIVGASTLNCGSLASKTCTPSGGTWSSSNPAVVTISATGGMMGGIAPGTATVTYTVATGCGIATATAVVTVTTPTLSVSSSPVFCSPGRTLLVSGGGTSYVWTPATGLSCTSCTYPTAVPTVTTTYTVTGCGASATITINADRIHGNITFSGTAPTSPTSKVWLIQYNPTDSSIVATDSVVTCYDSTAGAPYYQFQGKPAGNYLVKAKLLSSVTGSSGYIPTYGASTANWFSATSIAHTTGASNTQNINMIYGTVPSGPGFISGYVYAGAGKGTSTGVPNMLIYLKNATTGQVLTYTYTDGGGAYSFNGLSNGSYIIYPEDYGFYTTPSGVITLTNASSGATGVIFNQYALKGTIEPATVLAVNAVDGNNAISIHPNPTSGTVHINWQNQATGNGTITITDVAGREVYRSSLNINTVSGEQTISLDKLNSGIYIINVKSEGVNYNEKLMLNK
jgi:uncharacterized protein YjdB